MQLHYWALNLMDFRDNVVRAQGEVWLIKSVHLNLDLLWLRKKPISIEAQ